MRSKENKACSTRSGKMPCWWACGWHGYCVVASAGLFSQSGWGPSRLFSSHGSSVVHRPCYSWPGLIPGLQLAAGSHRGSRAGDSAFWWQQRSSVQSQQLLLVATPGKGDLGVLQPFTEGVLRVVSHQNAGRPVRPLSLWKRLPLNALQLS